MPKKYETTETISYMQFSPDGKRLAAIGDSDIYVVEANSGKLIEALVAAQTHRPQYHAQHGLWTGDQFLLWGGPKLKLPEISKYDKWTVSPESDLLAIYGPSEVRVVSTSSGRTILKKNIIGYCNQAQFSPDAKRILLAVDKGIHSIAISKDINRPQKPLILADTVFAFAPLPDNKRIVVETCKDRGLKLLDMETGMEVGRYLSPNADIMQALTVSFTGNISAGIATVYTGGSNQLNALRLIETETQRDLGLLKSTKGDVRCFCLSKDCKRIAAWGEDYYIQLWDLDEFIKTLRSADDPVLKKAQAAAELRNALFCRVCYGHKLERIYRLDHALLPAQAQFEYSGDEKKLYSCLTKPKSKLSPIPLVLRYGRKLFDVLNMGPGLMVSERVIDLLRSKGFRGWEPVPISPRFAKDQRPDGRYFGLKINNTCGPIVENALEGQGDFRPLVDLNKWNGSHLFRPDHSACYLVTERVIHALTNGGITGWKAERVTDRQEIVAPLPQKKSTTTPSAKPTVRAIPKVVGVRQSIEKVSAFIQKHELGRVKEKILGSVEDAVFLKCALPGKGTEASGATRLGGSPDLPTGTEWPRHKEKPLAFLAQLRLSDCAKLIDKDVLPASGLISFFAPYDQEKTWTIHEGGSLVLYTPKSDELYRPNTPADLPGDAQFDIRALTLRPILSLPHWESEAAESWRLGGDERDWYMNLLESNDALNKTREPRHQLLGHGQYLQGDAMHEARNGAAKARIAAKSERWRMILQLDSDEDWGIDWYGGRLHVFAPEADLKKAKFNRAWMVAQYT